MKHKAIAAIFLSVTLLFGSVTAYADKYFVTIDQNSAYAGMSRILSNFYENNQDASEIIYKRLEPLISMKENQEGGGIGTADCAADRPRQEPQAQEREKDIKQQAFQDNGPEKGFEGFYRVLPVHVILRLKGTVSFFRAMLSIS